MSGTLIGALLGLGAIVLGIAAWMASTAAAAAWFDAARAFTVVGFLVIAATLSYWIWTSSLSVPARAVLLFLTAGIALGLTFVSIVFIAEAEIRKLPVLFAGNDPDPAYDYACKAPGDALKVYYGTNLSWATRFPHIVLKVAGEEMLTVDKDEKGRLVVSTLRIFDDKDEILVRFDAGEYFIHPVIRKLRPHKSTLVAFDKKDNKVLDVRLVNAHSLVVSGIFRRPGVPPVIVDDQQVSFAGVTIAGSCFGEVGVSMSFG